jgi:hypothetical protein
METNDWQPFYSHAQFHPIIEQTHADENQPSKFWILQSGQKTGPLAKFDIQKKLEMRILGMNDLVSFDDGHTWKKFFQLEMFQSQEKNGDSLPVAPSESRFLEAKQELHEWMESHQSTENFQGLAAMAFLGKKPEGPMLNLAEIDLKSLGETEVSRSLKWALPAAVAGFGCLYMLGSFLFGQIGQSEVVETEPTNKQETRVADNFNSQNQRSKMARERNPASHRPMGMPQRSALTDASANYNEPYQTYNEPHQMEPEQPMDNPEAMDASPEPAQEHSLVSNSVPGNEGGESLDQAMNGGEAVQQPEPAVVEESGDF